MKEVPSCQKGLAMYIKLLYNDIWLVVDEEKKDMGVEGGGGSLTDTKNISKSTS